MAQYLLHFCPDRQVWTSSKPRVAGDLSPKQKRTAHVALERRDGKGCFYCGAAGATLGIDHAVPRSQGGTNARSNLRRSCSPCNRAKGSMSEEEFLKLVTPYPGTPAARRRQANSGDSSYQPDAS